MNNLDSPTVAVTPAVVKKTRKWPFVVVGVAAAFVFGTAVSGGSEAAEPTALPDVAVVAAEVPKVVPAEPIEAAGFGDGIYEVPTDMPRGKYKTTGEGTGCYFEVLKGDGSNFSDIIDNGFTEGQAVVTIGKHATMFESSGCGEWVAVK